MKIRTRLLLLVLGVWLPAAAGFGWLAWNTYRREVDAAREGLRQVALDLAARVERELDTRDTMARTLGGSSALLDGRLSAFHAEASAAMAGTGNWGFLVDRERQLLNTRVPADGDAVRPRPPHAPWTTGEPLVVFNPNGPILRRPVFGVFAPESRVAPPRYNVGIAFEPAVIQALVEDRVHAEGGLATVLDGSQRILARSRDPHKFLGVQATGETRDRLARGEQGYVRSTTLDGVASLTYIGAPNRYGWSVVIGLPAAALDATAARITLQAVSAAALLLVIGLVIALVAAQRISAPILALRGAAAELGRDGVPARLRTGVAEADEVSAALHDAGVRARDAKHLLERRVAEAVQEARDAQARLFEGQKHEAIGRLTGGIAHDFNNLLQTIFTGLHVMQRSAGDGPQVRVLQAALRACAKAADLVRQMLTFGRSQPLDPQPVEVADFILKSEELTGKALGERIRLTASIEAGLPPLFVDPTQLELALLNLVFNARDAMAGGGSVRIVARNADKDERARLGAGRFVALEVVDDGPGMDEATRARAFEPYFTTKPVGAGSGLGLSQVLAFARQSGGEARIESARGSGTRVVMLLPGSTVDATRPEAPVDASDRGAPLRLLMVEDDHLIAAVVVPALEHEGHAVTTCASADEAVRILTGDAPFDVLFTDVVMPGTMGGVELVEWCRAHRPSLPVLVATGYMAHPGGPTADVLRKPYTVEALLSALHRVVQARTVRPSVAGPAG